MFSTRLRLNNISEIKRKPGPVPLSDHIIFLSVQLVTTMKQSNGEGKGKVGADVDRQKHRADVASQKSSAAEQRLANRAVAGMKKFRQEEMVMDQHHGFYDAQTPTIRKIWKDPDVHQFFPHQLSVMFDPATPMSRQLHQAGPPDLAQALKHAPAAQSKVEPGTSANFKHQPQWASASHLPTEMQAAMIEALYTAEGSCQEMFEKLEKSDEMQGRREEARRMGLYDEAALVPPPFTPKVAEKSRKVRSSTETLKFNVMYTDHTTTLEVSREGSGTLVADLPLMKSAEINRFLQAHGLPKFDQQHYSYFFIPSATKTTRVEEWMHFPNSALVLHPRNRLNESYVQRASRIPALVNEVQELVDKVRVQAKMLKSLSDVVQPFWAAMVACKSCKEWQGSETAPSAFNDILHRSMVEAGQRRVEMEEMVGETEGELRRAATMKKQTLEQTLADSEREMQQLLDEKTRSKTSLDSIKAALRKIKEQRDSGELDRLKKDLETKESDYEHRGYPMHKVWARSFLSYVRRQILQDIVVAVKGKVPVAVEIDLFQFPIAYGSSWDRMLEEMKQKPEVLRRLSHFGLTLELLNETLTGGLADAGTPTTKSAEAYFVAYEGHRVKHRVTPHAVAAAILSSHLADMGPELEQLYTFDMVWRHGRIVDLPRLAADFHSGLAPATKPRAK